VVAKVSTVLHTFGTMIKATYPALIIVFIVMILTSCSSDNSLASFNKRKYTPGLFTDKPGSKDVIVPTVSKVATGAKVLPAVLTNNIPTTSKVKLVDSIRSLVLSVKQNIVKAKPAIIEKTHDVFYNKVNKTKIEDNVLNKIDGFDDHVDVKYVLIEIGFCVLAIGALIAAFPFLNNPYSLLLYTMFVFISGGFLVLAYLLGGVQTKSVVLEILIGIIAVCDFIALCILTLAGPQS
jgi:hypothetical protein